MSWSLNVLTVKRASVTLTSSSVLACPFPYNRVNETFFTEIQNFSVNSPWSSLEYHNITCGKTVKNVFLKYSSAHCEETKFYITGSERHQYLALTKVKRNVKRCICMTWCCKFILSALVNGKIVCNLLSGWHSLLH